MGQATTTANTTTKGRVVHRGLLLMLSGSVMLCGLRRKMHSRLELGEHRLLLHLLLLQGRHLLRRRLLLLGRRLSSRRWLRKVRLMKTMYSLLLLNVRDRGSHVHCSATYTRLLVIHQTAVRLRGSTRWSRCRRRRYHRHASLRHGRNQAGNIVQLAYLLLLLLRMWSRWRPVRSRVKVGCVRSMHRWHVTDGRWNCAHTMMGTTIDAATAARSLLLLDGRHRWPLLLLLMRMLLVLRGHG